MIADLKPYPEYRETGLAWLGRVPAHWSVRPIKTVLREADRRSEDGSGTLLSLTRIRGLIPHRQMTEKLHGAKTLAGYKCYRPGQIVMNRMQAWSGMFGAGAIEGLVSPDYAVFNLPGNNRVKLVLERLKAPDLVGQFALVSKGIGSGFNRLYSDRFGSIPMSLPPPEEQGAIEKFLEYTNGRMERAIRAKRKVIALVQEQKQAIIHRAVTRGLDPTVPIRPSGIPWLGDIPGHWRVSRLKFETSHIVDCLHATPHYFEDAPFPAIRTADIEPGRIRLSQARKVSASQFKLWTSRLAPAEGDILYSREGERYGIAALVPAGVQPLHLSADDGFSHTTEAMRRVHYVATQLSPCLQPGCGRHDWSDRAARERRAHQKLPNCVASTRRAESDFGAHSVEFCRTRKRNRSPRSRNRAAARIPNAAGV